MSVFEPDEYRVRLARVREVMAERGLDVLLVSSPENINYLTGYEGWSFYTHQLLAVGIDEGPVLVLRDMDIACAAFTSFLDADDVVGYPEDWIGTHDRHVMSYIAEVLRDRALCRGRVGVEMDAAYFTARARDELAAGLPDARLEDATALVNWVRLVKSPAEIGCMRAAAHISDRAMAVAEEAIAPGVRGCDASARIMAALVAGTDDAGGGFPVTLLVMPGERTKAPHLTWTDAPFDANTPVNIELGGCRHRYHAGLARTLFLGDAPDSLAALSDVVIEGMGAALDAMRPGVTCGAIERAWREVLESAGHQKESRIGYSIGLGFYPSWVEGTASLQRDDPTILAPGMTFHMICGMWKGEDNVELSETVLVTERGAEPLTTFPRRLIEVQG